MNPKPTDTSKDLLARLIGDMPPEVAEQLAPGDLEKLSKLPRVTVKGDIGQMAFTVHGSINFAAPVPPRRRSP